MIVNAGWQVERHSGGTVTAVEAAHKVRQNSKLITLNFPSFCLLQSDKVAVLGGDNDNDNECSKSKMNQGRSLLF